VGGLADQLQEAITDKVVEQTVDSAPPPPPEPGVRALTEWKVNAAKTPIPKARRVAEQMFTKAGKNLSTELPNFDDNYNLLKKKCAVALDVPRIQMPVIEPQDMRTFDKRLKQGRIDIFPPYAKGKLLTPSKLSKEEGEEWVELGVKDGNPKDDVIKGKWTSVAAWNLKPTQSQIWLDKLLSNTLKFGKPQAGAPILKKTIIVSSDGYILDGHHRYGQAMLVDPKLKIKALVVPMPISLLLKIGRSYGAAIGRKPKA
jgi:hypothetical protein